jgi:hypothetical protein
MRQKSRSDANLLLPWPCVVSKSLTLLVALVQAVALLAPQLLHSFSGQPHGIDQTTSSALQLDVSLSRLSLVFEAMEDFLDEVSLRCGAAWDEAASSEVQCHDTAVARASAWTSMSVRMAQQQMALDCMRVSVAAMLDGSCEASASQAVFSELVQLQQLQAATR